MRRLDDGPPRPAEALLRGLAPSGRADWIIGDLREEYRQRRRHRGRLRAGLWHWTQSVRIAARLAAARLRDRPPRTAGTETIPWGDPPTTMDSLLQDLRFGLRNLSRNPGFAAVAVLALALGIGANTAIFSVAHGVLRDLPYPGGERIVLLYEDRAGDGSGRMPLSGGELAALEQHGELFDGLTAYAYAGGILGGGPYPESVGMPMISHDFLDFLDVDPSLGRDFAESDLDGDGRVVLVGHELWQRRWNGDPDLVGDRILLDEQPATVIGIAPPELDYFNDTDRLYGLLQLSGQAATDFRAHRYYALARLPAGDPLEVVETRTRALMTPVQEDGGHGAERPHGLVLYSLYDAWVGNVREPLLMLMGAVGLLVLVACSNVANLQIAHGIRRQRELAVRVALGAGRGRVTRQLLTESGLLAIAGGACGLGLAALSMWWLRGLIGSNLPRVDNIGIDGAALAFTAALSMAAGLASGLVPGFLISSEEPVGTLRAGSPATPGEPRHSRARATLLVVQVAMAVVLAVGATLLAASFSHVRNVDLGVEPEDVVTSRLSFWGRSTEYPDGGSVLPVLEEILGRTRAFPDVRTAGMTSMLPGTGSNISDRFIVDTGTSAPAEPFLAGLRVITPGYLETMGLSVLRGRAFTTTDGVEGTSPVALVDERFAELNWPDGDAVGGRIRIPPFRDGQEPGPWMTVVGIVEGTRLSPYADDVEPMVYVPLRQRPAMGMVLVARMEPAPPDLAERLRTVVEEIDPGQPVSAPQPLEDILAAPLARQRLNTVLMACLAGLALLLAAVGEYAVLQHHAARRTREIGIRMALGAPGASVVRLIVRRGLLLGTLGIGVGLGSAWVGSRYLESALYGVEPHDPRAYAAVALALVLVALLASVLPARRAARTDPMAALRSE